MLIQGFQKTTLIDYPEKIACTIFLHGCNFRCGFCHNPELVLTNFNKEYSENEILEFLKKRKKYLDAVCITGGEPLMSLEKDFVKKIKALGYLVKIDTNGSFPEKLKELLDENLIDFVSMDIKSSKENYEFVVGKKPDFEKIEQSIKLISGLENYEFRTTILENLHNKDEVKKIAEWLNQIKNKPKRFCLQGFKKQDKLLDENFKKQKNTSEEYLNELKKIVENYFERVEVRV